jgi:DNA repair protein RadA/Sms
MGTRFLCADCGRRSAKWFGRCPDCGGWGTAAEPEDDAGTVDVVDLNGARLGDHQRWETGMADLDRVTGGGIVMDSVVLLAGEPGIGKSTLVLQLLDAATKSGRPALLCTGEESLAQVSLRAGRLGITGDALRACATTALEEVVAAMRSERPEVLIVDSIQSLVSRDCQGPAGSVAQVRGCTAALVNIAKTTQTMVVLVGHVTKEGAVAGPKTLEHMVDVVLTLDGERSGVVRLLRASKNRFGPCDETGVFVMTGVGLEPVEDPSSMLLADRRAGIPGSVVFPSLDGTRPMLVEIQALATESNLSQPRRVPIGLDPRRVMLVTGAATQHGAVKLAGKDVFVAAAGGITVREPAADLAIAMALRSASTGSPIGPDLVAIGEVGLGGEVRRVPGIERRITEAARLGFSRVLAPRDACPRPGIDVVNVLDLSDAFVHSGWTAGSGAPCYP